MRRSTLLTVLGICIVAVTANSKEPGLDDVIVAYRIRTAFLEQAPWTIARSMRKAVVEACRRIRADRPNVSRDAGTRYKWLCDGSPLTYLREVLVTGIGVKDGYVCSTSELSVAQKFCTPDELAEDGSCEIVWYENGEHAHEVLLLEGDG